MAAPAAGKLPSGFDWKAYVGRYSDLRAAGIATEAAAERHWLRYGAREGRWGTEASYETRATLACPSIHSIFLRATGALVCWDDAGSSTTLQAFDADIDYGRDVYLGRVFNDIRLKLHDGKFPFPQACRSCLVLRGHAPHSSYHLDNRVVEVFQVEPSFKCTLDCPGCIPLGMRRQASPRNLDAAVLQKILRDFKENGIVVRAFDFQGHGEPLMHRDLWRMTRLPRQAYPDSYITVTTNAQGVVRDEVRESGIDEVVCAIDGVDQETFQPYRIRGSFELAYRFMRDFATHGKSATRPVKVIWKYILFEHNSSDENLGRLQTLAEEAGVGEIVLVFTRSGPRARHLHEPSRLRLRPSRVPVSVRFHEPDVADLRRRLATAKGRLQANDVDGATDLILSVASGFARFFPGMEALLPAHRDVLESLREGSEFFPVPTRRAVAELVRHLR